MKLKWLLPLLLTEAFMGLTLLAYFQKFPIFPEFSSLDPRAHMALASSLLKAGPPAFNGQILYYGVEYLLAFGIWLAPSNPLVAIREVMAVLVFLSPLAVRLLMGILVDGKSADWTSAFYAASGFAWFPAVFDSGLYPQFFGVLASLLLVASAANFLKSNSHLVSSVFVVLAYAVALFSHYSILLLIPPLLVYVLLEGRLGKRSIALSAFLVAPLFAGLFLFPSLPSILFAFLSESAGQGPAPTGLSPLFYSVYPPLSFLLAAIGNDYLAVFCFASIGVVAQSFWKFRKPWMLLLLSWFLVSLLVSPSSGNAWRFAFAGLTPLALISGWSLAQVWPAMKNLGRLPGHYHLRQFGVMALLVFPVFFPSWGAYAVNSSLLIQQDYSTQQQQVYDSFSWLSHHNECGGNLSVAVQEREGGHAFKSTSTEFIHAACNYVAVDDWEYLYSEYMGHPAVVDAALGHVDCLNPSQTSLFALSQHAEYLIVTKLPIDCIPPNPAESQWLQFAPLSLGCASNACLVLNETFLHVFKIVGT